MRRAIIAILLIVVAASGCMNTSQPEDTGPQNTDNPANGENQMSGNNTVFYTDSGFQPQTLEIEQGETVTWLDRSSNDMWVATDSHPSHTLYDGSHRTQHCQNGESSTFDQCDSGEEYSFTFNEAGNWGYHNHRSSGDMGTVIVN